MRAASSPLPTSAFLPSIRCRRASNGGGTAALRSAPRPVLLGDEGVDLGLAVADHLQGHRLHAAGREPLLDLLPEERREAEAHHAVEDAPGLLGVDLLEVDRAAGSRAP